MGHGDRESGRAWVEGRGRGEDRAAEGGVVRGVRRTASGTQLWHTARTTGNLETSETARTGMETGRWIELEDAVIVRTKIEIENGFETWGGMGES